MCLPGATWSARDWFLPVLRSLAGSPATDLHEELFDPENTSDM